MILQTLQPKPIIFETTRQLSGKARIILSKMKKILVRVRFLENDIFPINLQLKIQTFSHSKPSSPPKLLQLINLKIRPQILVLRNKTPLFNNLSSRFVTNQPCKETNDNCFWHFRTPLCSKHFVKPEKPTHKPRQLWTFWSLLDRPKLRGDAFILGSLVSARN